MSGAWRPNPGQDRYAVPIEMRFIDLFMAALGALVFVAMLFAFLVKHVPRRVISPPPPPAVKPLQLITRELPHARARQRYEVAFAYRGGMGAVSWQVVAGGKEIPAGLRFDAGRGVLTGMPKGRGTARFVLQVEDANRKRDARPYVLTIEPPLADSKAGERWLIYTVLGVAILTWMFSLLAVNHMKALLANLQTAAARGEPSYQWETAAHVVETIELPAGVKTYEVRLQGTRIFSRFAALVMVFLVVWLLWRIFG